MGCGRQRDEDGDARDSAAPGVEHREEPQREERDVDGEERRDEAAVDRLDLCLLDEDEQAHQEDGGHPRRTRPRRFAPRYS